MKPNPQYDSADINAQPIRDLVSNIDLLQQHACDETKPLEYSADLVTWYRNTDPRGQNLIEFNRCTKWCKDADLTPNLPISRGYTKAIMLNLALDVPGLPEVKVQFSSPILASSKVRPGDFDLRDIISPVAMCRPHRLIRIAFDWEHDYARLVTTDFDNSHWAFHVQIK